MDFNSIRNFFRSRSRSRRAPIIAAALIVGAALDASAADCTFQNAGGDLASTDSADWGGTAPGSSDNAIVNQAGTYTLSSDVTFGRLRVRTTGSTFNLSGHNQTAALFVENVANAHNVFRGGCDQNLSGTDKQVRPQGGAKRGDDDAVVEPPVQAQSFGR